MVFLYLYCWLPLAVKGANPGIKKCRRGNGTMLTANFLKSAFNWPGKRRQVVTPKNDNKTNFYEVEQERSENSFQDRENLIKILKKVLKKQGSFRLILFSYLTWSMKPSGSSPHRLDWQASRYGSRCRTRLRCQCNMFRLCFPPKIINILNSF